MTQPEFAAQSEVVARPHWEFRARRYVMAGILLGAGLWCLYDGFVKYPRENRAAESAQSKIPHSNLDLRFNRTLAVLLPIGAALTLVHLFRTSRGEYRLAGQMLHIPGHPPIPLSSLKPIDEKNLQLWERKGIVYVSYEQPQGGAVRQFKLDDFVFERKATDEIFDRIKAVTNPVPTDSAASVLETPEPDQS